MAIKLSIGDHEICNPLEPYIIAEIGVNHEGSLETAKRLIEQAADAGANAAKFQTYKAEKLASKHSPAYWDTTKEATESQYKLFKKYDSFGESEYQALAAHCEQVGIDFLSTPFDLEAVDFLDGLMPAFKIASADITNVPLIRSCASRKKPLIISTGASTLPEIEFAVRTAREAGADQIALLHCVLNYPTPPALACLSAIDVLKKTFPEHVVGYSDHVVPDENMSALTIAVLKGAMIIEKHFTHDKSLPGNDHYHAMDAGDLRRFNSNLAHYAELIGCNENSGLANQNLAREHARRSIVAKRKIKAGEILTEENLTTKRPAHGVSPTFWDDVIGRCAAQDIEEDSLLSWPMISMGDRKQERDRS